MTDVFEDAIFTEGAYLNVCIIAKCNWFRDIDHRIQRVFNMRRHTCILSDSIEAINGHSMKLYSFMLYYNQELYM